MYLCVFEGRADKYAYSLKSYDLLVMSTLTSFVEEAQALHQKLQLLIEAASPNANKAQVNWGLLKEVASYLKATP